MSSAIPTRSPDGRAALDVFYEDFNDVHFFVEDEDQENLYEVILRKILPELRITRIFPLGGKAAVLAHCEQQRISDTGPNRIYIVDKDFDDVLGLVRRQPNLLYLDQYCIENYFADPEAIVEVVVESWPKLKRAEIVSKLDIERTLSEISSSLRPLFQLFFCVQRFKLGIRNSSFPVERFCREKHRWMLDPALLEQYKTTLAEAASGTPLQDVLADPFVHPEVIALQERNVHQVVGGKHICAMLFHYVKSKYALGTITLESFLYRIAKNSKLHPLSNVACAVRAITSNPPRATVTPNTSYAAPEKKKLSSVERRV